MKVIKNFWKYLDFITDVLYVPVILIALVVTIAIFNIRETYTVPNMFGYSVVKIVSGSMVNSGFNKGDTVAVKSVEIGTLEKGDIIAFYYYNTGDKTKPAELAVYDETTAHLRTKETNNNGIIGLRSEKMTEAASKGKMVCFHTVADIRIAPDGTLWFRTWGTSNVRKDGSPLYDTLWIREDLIVGKYTDSSEFFRGALTFASTSIGILVLVTLPCGILLLMLILVFMEALDALILERKVLRKILLLTDKICVDKDIGFEMNKRRKLTVLSYAAEDEKETYMALLYRDYAKPADANTNSDADKGKNKDADKTADSNADKGKDKDADKGKNTDKTGDTDKGRNTDKDRNADKAKNKGKKQRRKHR